jgi:hypothetical protein
MKKNFLSHLSLGTEQDTAKRRQEQVQKQLKTGGKKTKDTHD